METNVILWHSTEGTSLPSYGGGGSAPTFTARPDFAEKRLVWYQHFDFDVSARALMNRPGGVETNTLNVCQVEIVGTCDPATHQRWGNTRHLYMPELPDWAIRDLAAFARWAHEQHGVPLTSGLAFKPYPSSYGANGVRMTAAQWAAFKGHCGHQHAPENDHGDPGAFPIGAVLAAAKGDPSPTPAPEDDMPTAAEVAAEIVRQLPRATWQTDGLIANVNAATRDDNPSLSPAQALANTEAVTRRMDRNVAALLTQVAGLTATVQTLADALGRDVDTATVVAAVEQAIAAAVVKVDVSVRGADSA
jgi:hypothetical protein